MKDNVETPITDIAELAQQALQNAIKPEAVKQIVEKQIGATVESAIKDAVRSYSPFGRDLEKKVQEALSINELNLPAYNAMVGGMITKLVEENVSELIEGRLQSDIKEMLGIAPKTIKLSKLVEEMVQYKKDYGDDAYGDVVTCHVEPDDHRSNTYPYWKIYLDEDEHYSWRDRESADIVICISGVSTRKEGQDKDDVTSGKIYHISKGGGAIGDRGGFTRTKLHGLPGRILAMYAAETEIEIDEDEVVVSIGDY